MAYRQVYEDPEAYSPPLKPPRVLGKEDLGMLTFFMVNPSTGKPFRQPVTAPASRKPHAFFIMIGSATCRPGGNGSDVSKMVKSARAVALTAARKGLRLTTVVIDLASGLQ